MIRHFGTDCSFPSVADDRQPMAVCIDRLVSDDVLAVREEVPVLTFQMFTDKGVPLITPVVAQDIRWITDKLFSQDDQTDGGSGLSLPICGRLIHRGAVGLDGQDLDHWGGVVWDPGIVCLQCCLVCSDCHVWAEWSFSTAIESGCCRTITWTLGYLEHIDQPCDVGGLCGRVDWTIYELVMVVTPGGCDDIRLILEMVVYMFCAYVLLCIFCSQGFPRFASLSGVIPQVLIRGIVRSFLVFEHVCAGVGGGGGGSVTIGQYRSSLWWPTVGG